MSIYQYELIRELGSGGMGTVYLARDTRLGRRVAIKLLQQSARSLNKRFMLEAQATARCNHENIVVIHEVGEYHSHPYMVLEYLKGQTLRQWLREHAAAASSSGQPVAVPPGRAVALMLPVVRALVYAHARGIVHRDLKPENVMLTRSGTIKVLDFGIAKLLSAPMHDEEGSDGAMDANSGRWPAPRAVRSSALIGTLPYMSPEQMNQGVIDHRTDVWTVGIMLFELVTGRHPMPTCSTGDLLRIANLDEPMPSMGEVMPDLGPEMGPLGSIIDRCLLKHPENRTPSARVLLAELEALAPERRMRPWRRWLRLALSPVILLGLMLWLGAAVHNARLMLIGLSGTELSYPGAELLGTGLGASARMVWYALAGPLTGTGVEGWGVLPLIALAGTALVLSRRARLGVLLPWLAILLFVFALGTLFYVHAVGVHHVVKPGLGAEWPCRLGPSLPEQIRFEVCSWLSNDSLVNERRRMALAGLWLWFVAALALATWLSWNTARRIRNQRYLGWYRVAGGGLAAAHGLLLVSLLVQAPRAYAIAYWGLRYPRVTTVEPACDPALAEAVAAGTCRVLSVGHEADGDLVILHGTGCPGATPSSDEHGERAAPAEMIRSVHLENRQPMRSSERCVRHTEGTELIPNRD
jgi:tRNA A-37 threonylcarbamoyl transferase component Bud32